MRPMARQPDSTKLARALSVTIIFVTGAVGVVLMTRGAVHGVALVLSAGLLGALYARLVLNWQPRDPTATTATTDTASTELSEGTD